jgi:exopolysaccharide biosynthesis polyprenyl glycosylphosphotransferase
VVFALFAPTGPGWIGYVMAGVSGLLLLLALRLAFRAMDRGLATRGIVGQRAVIAGVGQDARQLAVRLRALASTVKVTGFVQTGAAPPARSLLGRPVLGDIHRLRQIHEACPFDVLILSGTIWGEQETWTHEERFRLVNVCEALGVQLYVVPNMYDVSVSMQEVATFSDVPLIRLRDASGHLVYAGVKRLADILGAVLLGVLLTPVWLAAAAAIKLTSKGPVLYTQVRVGQHGRSFRMIKFRSMVDGAEDRLEEVIDVHALSEPVFKVAGDPRVTRVGRFLRSTGLDELPQLWNILKGEMSFVGPRPEQASIVAMYNHFQRRRLKAKPGLTGLQQVECRGTPSLSRRIAYDLVYMKHQGPILDLYIVLKTIPVILRRGEVCP